MKISLYQVDAFANKAFSGNPAAVCPLDNWIDDSLLQKIATENNLSETAFFVAKDSGFQLRWFTPEAEVELCGHATLATAHVLYQHLGFQEDEIAFYTLSGTLIVSQENGQYRMTFPATMPSPCDAPTALLNGLNGVQALEVTAGFDYIVEVACQAELMRLNPDFTQWLTLDLRGVVVTAPGDNDDFVSRCFFPKLQVNEDPVTGSAHCELTPYWAVKLDKTQLSARQLSKREGQVSCELIADKVVLKGTAADYLKGEITL